MQTKLKSVSKQDAVLIVVSASIVAISAIAASEGGMLGVNMLLFPLLGCTIAVVVGAAILGHGRTVARTRVIGLALVVALTGTIQLVQLWNDGLGMRASGIAMALVALTLLGLAGAVLGRRVPAREAGVIDPPALRLS